LRDLTEFKDRDYDVYMAVKRRKLGEKTLFESILDWLVSFVSFWLKYVLIVAGIGAVIIAAIYLID